MISSLRNGLPWLCALVLAGPAAAQTVYAWEDSAGLHFTDDASAVPAGATRVDSVTFAPRPAVQPGRLLTVGPPLDEGPASRPFTVSRLDPEAEASWRGRFHELHRKITWAREALGAMVDAVPPPMDCMRFYRGYCVPNPEHGLTRVAIAQWEAELAQAVRDLEALEREANLRAVPREWRRGY